ncbi:MAG: glycosyltransferase [Actinobacteria bacterium]|nr:glycosyltransferase [Actinomycetota bacterium]
MIPERLRVLVISPRPFSPPRIGGQVRPHGLMRALAQRHDLTVISLFDDVYDPDECRAAMAEYCDDVILIPNPNGRKGARRRVQLRSVFSNRSFDQHWLSVPELQKTLDRVVLSGLFDVVHLEFPISPCLLRLHAAGPLSPPIVLNTAGIENDLGRQIAANDRNPARRLYREIAWRKLRRYERAAFRASDGICACSRADQRRMLADIPAARTALVPNAADVDHFRRLPSDQPPDSHAVVFFGLLSFPPNIDGLLFFLRDVWPRIAAQRPDTHFKIIGRDPPPAILKLAGARVEITGFVDDLREELSRAAVLVAPLRLGAGTRLKILEGMAMGLPIVSTTLGAEGIDVTPNRDIVIADDPTTFAASVVRLLDEPALATSLGCSARQLMVERYSWRAAAKQLEDFYFELIRTRRGRNAEALERSGSESRSHLVT